MFPIGVGLERVVMATRFSAGCPEKVTMGTWLPADCQKVEPLNLDKGGIR